MKKIFAIILVLFFCEAAAQSKWVTGYVASWSLNMTGVPGGAGAANFGNCPYYRLDLEPFTHLLLFPTGLKGNGYMKLPISRFTGNDTTEWDGSVTWSATMMERRRKPFIDYVHSKGKPILCTFFLGDTSFTTMLNSPGARANACKTIADSVCGSTYKFDGVDLDLEPHVAADTAKTRTWFRQLYDTLQNYHAWYDTTKKPLMTTAIYRLNTFWASCYMYFDQLNVMSYDLAWTGLGKTWHNCPVLAGSAKDIYGVEMPSIQNRTRSFIQAGIPAAKIGAGVSLNAHVFKGGKLITDTLQGCLNPLDRWVGPGTYGMPTEPKYGEWMYFQVYGKFITDPDAVIKYDTARKVPYAYFDSTGQARDYYVTYEDSTTMREAVTLADTMTVGGDNIGGLMVWGAAESFLQSYNTNGYSYPDSTVLPGGVRDGLMQAMKAVLIARSFVTTTNYPTITVSQSAFNFGNIILGSTGDPALLTVGGEYFLEDAGYMTIMMPSGFYIQTDAGLVDSLQLTYADSTRADTTLTIMFNPGAVQVYSGLMSISVEGTSQQVTLTGECEPVPTPYTRNSKHYLRLKWR